jgi:hypothetical protein
MGVAGVGATSWSEARVSYPSKWLLVEARVAETHSGVRHVKDVAVLDVFEDSVSAMKRYEALHHEGPHRELYVVHTSRTTLQFAERHWLGIRAAS